MQFTFDRKNAQIQSPKIRSTCAVREKSHGFSSTTFVRIEVFTSTYTLGATLQFRAPCFYILLYGLTNDKN